MASSTAESPELAELLMRLGELSDLNSASTLLGWDRETQMPAAGARARGEVAATIDKVSHQRLADPAVGELIESVAAQVAGGAESDAAAIVRVVRRDHERAVRVPPELTAEMARATAAALPAWQEARGKNEFAVFQPFL